MSLANPLRGHPRRPRRESRASVQRGSRGSAEEARKIAHEVVARGRGWTRSRAVVRRSRGLREVVDARSRGRKSWTPTSSREVEKSWTPTSLDGNRGHPLPQARVRLVRSRGHPRKSRSRGHPLRQARVRRNRGHPLPQARVRLASAPREVVDTQFPKPASGWLQHASSSSPGNPSVAIPEIICSLIL